MNFRKTFCERISLLYCCCFKVCLLRTISGTGLVFLFTITKNPTYHFCSRCRLVSSELHDASKTRTCLTTGQQGSLVNWRGAAESWRIDSLSLYRVFHNSCHKIIANFSTSMSACNFWGLLGANFRCIFR